jgi:hypothetical protein
MRSRLLLLSLTLACAGAAQAQSDVPIRPVTVLAQAASAMPMDERKVVPLREPQIVVTRLSVSTVAAIAEEAVVGQGTMLLALGAMIAWIAGRRR